MNRPPTPSPVTVVDLGIQNVRSVVTALELVGASTRVVSSPDALSDAGLVVVPGVGSFAAASRRLIETGLGEGLREHVLVRGRPLFGMCLGMQLLADSGEEHGENQGLGLIPGRVVRLRDRPPEWRVPNIGWRELQLTLHNSVVPASLDSRAFYHVHSYHMMCDDSSHVAGTSAFGGQSINSVVQRENVVGSQFHPEKSQDAGLDLLHAVWQRFG